jgi:F-type H+-transporting ATPase subunit b
LNRIGTSLGAAGLAAAPALVVAADRRESVDPDVVEVVGHAAPAAHPSPSLFSVDPGLLIWTILTFVVVLVVLRFTAWGPLVRSLAARQRSIEGAIEEARRIKTEAECLLSKHEEMLKSAKDEARAIVEESRADGRRVQAEIRAAAQREASEFKERAMREIDLQKDAAVGEIWDLTAELSTDLAARILGRRLDGSDQDRLVKELLAQMRTEMGGERVGS